MAKNRKYSIRRIIQIPREYLEAVKFGNIIFASLFQFENGLRLAIHKHQTICYGTDWWNVSLKTRLPRVFEYAEEQQKRRDAMPWIGSSSRVVILPIHLLTLGHLEEIVKKYQSDCIPELFPTMEFFLGHMESIKRVRNLFSHMFPCITSEDCRLAKREILTLASHINSKLSQHL
ncbi:MAG: hypothetical protein ACREOO_32675 [bacterium]